MKQIQLNAEKRDILFRSLIALAMLSGTALLQTSFLSGADLFGTIPDLLLILSVGVCFFNGARIGIPFCIGAGLAGYFFGGGTHTQILLMYSLIGILLCAYFSSGRRYVEWCVYMAIAVAFKAVWSFFVCLLFSAVPRPFSALWYSILPELLGTGLLSLALYYPVKLAARLLKRKSEL